MSKPTRQQAPGMGATTGYPEFPSKVRHALETADASEVFTLTLNGQEVKAVKGETIIEVCHREDQYVPHYCWHPALSIAGNCRLCLVEVEKVPKPVIACQTPVTPGMVVRTESEMAKECQKGMMEFLLVNHPLDCPICDRGGECQLQRYSMEYGTGHTRMADQKRKFIKPQADPLIDIERNRCIMCTRCVRFCDEVGGEHVMGVFDRGNGNYIGTFGQGPVSNVLSGNVIDLCPVGCLTNKQYRFKARPWELKQTQSTCDQCASGCKVTSWTRNNQLYRTTPPSRKRFDHFTVNEDTEEFICNQGRFGGDYSRHADRQDQHMILRAGRLTPSTLEEAVAAAARQLRDVIATHGPESVAIAVSPRATLEEGHLASQLAAKVIGTASIDWRSRFADKAAADAVSLALDCADGSLANDPDVVVVVNGKLIHQSPILAQRIQELARRAGTKLVLLGHLHDSYLAEHAALQIHVAVGKTADLLAALASGDAAALSGFGVSEAQAAEYRAITTTGVTHGLVVHNLEDFKGYYAPEEVPAAIGLRAQLGDGWGYLPVVLDRNAVGLHAVGAEPGKGGVALVDLPEAMHSGRIKAVVALGSDALSALGNHDRVMTGLAKLDTFVAIDLFSSPINDRAKVFLALAANLERDGVYADIEGNVALMRAATELTGGSQPGWRLLSALGRALGGEDFGVDGAVAAWSAVRKSLAPASTITLDELELEGSTNEAHFVRRRILGGARNRDVAYNPGNYRNDGLHLRASAVTAPSAGERRPAAPSANGLTLVWGSHVSGRGYLTDRAQLADTLRPRPYLEVNRADAERLGVETDQFAVLTAGGEKTKVAVKVTAGPAIGHVFLHSGVHGPLDAAGFTGPVSVELQPLAETAPNQGHALVGAGLGGETH